MEKSIASSFEDHYYFKCLLVNLDTNVRDTTLKKLRDYLQETCSQPQILQLFLEKLSKELKEKLIPKFVSRVFSQEKDLLGVDMEFSQTTYNGKRISDKYFPSDFYSKPHFLFFVKFFSEKTTDHSNVEDTAAKIVEVPDQLTQITESESWKSSFVFTVNLNQEYAGKISHLANVHHLVYEVCS